MNCKKGDLAYVVKSDFPENIGAVVEVIEPDVDRSFQLGAFMWRVKTAGRPMHSKNLNTGKLRSDAMTGVAFDDCLRPITGWTPEPGVIDEVFDPVPLFGEPGFPFGKVQQ